MMKKWRERKLERIQAKTYDAMTRDELERRRDELRGAIADFRSKTGICGASTKQMKELVIIQSYLDKKNK